MNEASGGHAHCANCGAALADRYCSRCGQDSHVSLSFGHFLHEFVEGMFHVDSSFWRTLRALVTRPGLLTEQYLGGKRRAYSPPFRTYLVISVVYFIAASMFDSDIPASAGIHAWTAGAIGLMTLAVMTRATLGHTGQALRAGPATQAIYVCVLAGALLRVCAAVAGSLPLIEAGGALWVAGFAGYALVYARLLVMRKPAWAQARC